MNRKILVCELGFSAMKWRYEGRQGRIPSAYQRTPDGSYIFGEQSLILAGSSYLRTPEDLLKFYPHFVQFVKKTVGVTNEPHTLVVGLPYSFWQNANTLESSGKKKNAIATLTESLKDNTFVDIKVYPQGLGGILKFIHQQGKNAVVGNILGVDIGFNTLIYCLYSQEAGRIIYGDTSYKKGIHQMATRLLLPKIAEYMPARSPSPVEISYMIERGYIQYGASQIDIVNEINAAARAYVEETMADIFSELQAHLGPAASFQHMLFFGGGARLLPAVMESSSNINLEILDKPEYANAEGLELMALKSE